MSADRRPLTQNPRFWIISFLIWFTVLNLLSHGDKFHPPGSFHLFDIPHIDKVVHFGYFFGGGGLLSAALFFSKSLTWKRLTLIVTLSLALIGIWDEFHQSFFANRTGNDPADWLADVTGALCGALVFRATHRRFLLAKV